MSRLLPGFIRSGKMVFGDGLAGFNMSLKNLNKVGNSVTGLVKASICGPLGGRKPKPNLNPKLKT